jgi:predicted TIM-barrel fold metal-dependent hydrolase
MSGYRDDGPEELRPVGETEFARRVSEDSERRGGTVVAGIVGYADLRLGARVEDVLQAHVDAGGGRFRGIRHATSWDADPSIRRNHAGSPEGLMREPVFLDGLAVLGRMGLSFDAWLYHPQIPELTDAARAVPDVTIVLDHLGGPLGIGPYEDRDAMLPGWRAAMAELASCPNVFVKLGGIGMPIFGFPWDRNEKPPSSEELAATWGPEIRHCIDRFGPERCMFESNFPVDKRGCSYVVLWNAFKRMAAGASDEDKRWLFHDSAATAYRLPILA